MDQKIVQAQLAEAQIQIIELEEKLAAWKAIAQGFEGWLRIYGTAPQPRRATQARSEASTPIGKISMRVGVLRVLEEARGQTLTSKEILDRALGMGVISNAKHPTSIVDLVAGEASKDGQTPIEKVGPRMWRWTKEDSAPSLFALPTANGHE